MSQSEDKELHRQLEEALARVRDIESRMGLCSTALSSDTLFKVGLEQIHEGLQIVDHHWCYLYVNEAAARQGRKTRGELIGHKMMDVYPGFEKSDFFAVMEEVMKERAPRHVDNEFQFPDGSKGWFEIHIEPHPVGILIRSMDVSRRKDLESQYYQAQKMESIGLLAGGIAHDFNNKLGVMVLFCEMIGDQLLPEQDKAKGFIDNLYSAVNDCARLTRQLLAFSRQQVLDIKVINLNDLITSKLQGLEKLLGETIQMRAHLDGNLGNVRADASQLDHVLLNLCLNARDALSRGGHLTIETANVELDGEYCAAHPEVIPGSYVMVSVSDDGDGMTPEVQKRIFEPFFTTKEKGRGTGLGLAAVHGVIHQVRGHIWVYSEFGMGTTFKIYLPKVREGKDDIAERKIERATAKGTECLLLVEDDELLRRAFCEALEAAGYRVLSAANAEEARGIFAREKERIALLLTDVVLPRHKGSDLAKEILARKPGLKVVYVSGYTKNSIVHNGVLDTESVLLQKPVRMTHLLDTIRKVLDGVYSKGVF